MSTLRINNIEAQSIPASPTLDEKVKITNSSGDILVNIDGKTSGITTIGINTTDGNIKFDANSNVLITGILTATTLAGNFTPDSLEIGSNIKLGNAGVITATSFVGSGANLTGVSAVSVANQADNRVITNTGTTDALNAEANLTFSGSELVADSSMITAQNTGAGSGASKIQLQPYGTDGYINCTASGNLYTRMGTGFTTRTQIDSNGNFTVSSGNLVIGTAGKGIDFSATSDATHTAVTSGAQPSTDSEVLTDYEHGTWTPRLRAYDHAGGAGWNTMKYTDGTEVTGTGRYVRMGNHVWAGFKFESGSKVFDSSWTYWSIDSTPYGANHYDKASGSLYVSQTNFFTDSNSHIGGFVHGNESYMVVNKPNGHSNATINTSNNNRYCYGHISIYTSRT